MPEQTEEKKETSNSGQNTNNNGGQNTGNSKTISQKEYDELVRKATNFDIIESEPELVTKVTDHFRGRFSGNKNEQR